MLFRSLIKIIPAPATSAALIFVGFSMLDSLKKVNYSDPAQSAATALLLIFMVGTGSIGTGIGIGLIAYSMIRLITGKGREVSIVTYILALLFIGKFFITF